METEKGLPENWRERIASKKVVLYITSVSNLLNGEMKHIEKIEQVIETFRQQSEVVLWWRPHPLELSTIESMHPELAAKYIAIRTRYENETWGIFDTSADLHRAIAISDAYYGDWSSVIQLYKVTGKPILIASDDVRELLEQPEILYWVADFWIHENKLFFISHCFNLLFVMDMDTFEIRKIIEVTSDYPFQTYSFFAISHIENELIILPAKGNYIASYNILTQKPTQICTGTGNQGLRYNSYMVRNEKELYLLPFECGTVGKYHVGRKEYENVDNIFRSNARVSRIHVETEEFLYAVKQDSNIIYRFQKETNLCEEIELGEEDERFWGITKIKDVFIIPHTDKCKITLWNESTNKITNIIDFPADFRCCYDKPYKDMIRYGTDVYLFPQHSNMILKLDIEKQRVEECFLDIKQDYTSTREAYSCVKLVDNQIYAYANYKNLWQIFEPDTGLVMEKPMVFTEEQKQSMLNRSMLGEEIQENDSCKGVFCNSEDAIFHFLSRYINDVKKYKRVKEEDKIINVGKVIHEEMIR